MRAKISKHFTLGEFMCKCGCGQNIIEGDLVCLLELIRALWEKPLIIHSANRCKAHNLAVSGVENSTHCRGMAVDFHIKGVSIKQLHKKLLSLYNDGAIKHIGFYEWGCHVDIRKGIKSKWGKALTPDRRREDEAQA